MINKAGSIHGHLNILFYLEDIQFDQIMGLNPLTNYGESGYVNMFLNFGILFLSVYILIGLITIWRLLRLIRSYNEKPGVGLFYGAFFFSIAYYIGMFNLPIDTIFPLNLILVVCVMLPLFNYKKHSREASVCVRVS